MSLSYYDKDSQTLTNIAAGQRVWVGNKSSYEAAKIAGTLPNNAMICITDDSNDNSYSTDEKLTGKFWIDGKPIYRKVIDCGVMPNATSKTTAHNISNLGTVVTLYGVGTTTASNNARVPLPRGSSGGATDGVDLYVDVANVTIRVAVNYTAYTAYVILEYTKTTD